MEFSTFSLLSSLKHMKAYEMVCCLLVCVFPLSAFEPVSGFSRNSVRMSWYRRPGFEPRSGRVGFVVGRVALGQVFSKYFGFPCQFLFRRLLHTHHLSSGTGTIGQLVADVPSGRSLTPPHETKLNIVTFNFLESRANNTMDTRTREVGAAVEYISLKWCMLTDLRKIYIVGEEFCLLTYNAV
jgi:hypothetical protein